MRGRRASNRSDLEDPVPQMPPGPAINFPPLWNGAPTQDFPVIRRNPETGARFWPLFAHGQADVVYGSRFNGKAHQFPYFRQYLANKTISLLFSVLHNKFLSDIEVCYKMFTREVLALLTLRRNDFGFEIEFSANVARKRDLRIHEVGISYCGRTYAQGKKINWKDGLKAIFYVFWHRLV